MKKILLICIGIVIGTIIVACGGTKGNWFEITYEYNVGGSAKTARVNYTIKGGSEVTEDVALPWKYSFDEYHERDFLACIEVENTDIDGGSIKIKLDVEYLDAEYATCDGYLCKALVCEDPN